MTSSNASVLYGEAFSCVQAFEIQRGKHATSGLARRIFRLSTINNGVSCSITSHLSKMIMMRFAMPSVLLLLMMSSCAWAAGVSCSIPLPKNTPYAALAGLAKVSLSAAQKAAGAMVKPPATGVDEGELEIEDGCLVYSFYMRIGNRNSEEEIHVDAGTGKVLHSRDESAAQDIDNTEDKEP